MPVTLNKAAIKKAAQDHKQDDSISGTTTKTVPHANTAINDPNNRTRVARIAGLQHPPSEQQIDIFEFVDREISNYQTGRPTSNLAVEAVAGAGKTTVIVAAANLIPSNLNVAFLAFNKSIADELKKRLPAHVKAKTLNGLGHGLLLPYLRGLGVVTPEVRTSRTFSIMSKLLTYPQMDEFKKDIKHLVAMCKSLGIVPVGIPDAVGATDLSATDEVLKDLCVQTGHMIDPATRNFVFQKVREVLAISFSDTNLYEGGVIDYDDQKFITVCKRPNGRTLAKPQYDVIIVDETQDLNITDIKLIEMVIKDNGLIIGVGDTFQSIYGFRSGGAETFSDFKDLFKTKTLPLDITYRCGSALVKHAQELVPSIKAGPNAITGSVESIQNWSSKTFKAQDMVLCRNNAPLIDFAFKLIKDRVPVFVKGRNIGKGLIGLIEDLASEKVWVPNPNRPGKSMPKWSCENVTVQTLVRKLDEWRRKQLEIIDQDDTDNEDAKLKIHDKYDSIMIFIADNKDGMVQSVIDVIDGMFADDNIENAVVCSTIHKSKGLEADRVYHYRRDLMYSGQINIGSQMQQERNLDYVARTRGKELYAYLAGE